MKTIENRRTKERIVIRVTGEESGGERLGFDFHAAPGGGVPIAHYHAKQSEHFHMIDGELVVCVEGREVLLRPGDELTIPPGTKHFIENRGEAEAHCYVEYRPALMSEWWFSLVHPFEDQVGREATVLELAPFLARGVELYPAGLPRWLGRPALVVLGWIGRLLGKDRAVVRASREYFERSGTT